MEVHLADLVKVLAIDGGGIRGIVPAMVLAEIERVTDKSIALLFDLIVGTSTGGVIALGLTMRDVNGSPRYTAENLVKLYEDHGKRIFSRSLLRTIIHINRAFGAKYSSRGLESVLRDYFRAARLKDALADVLIPSYEIKERNPLLFSSRQARMDPERDFPLVEVARATTAAPTYFAPARIRKSRSGRFHVLVDGGVYANNPAMCAFAEARFLYPDKEILLVSLGTGDFRESLPYTTLGRWGVAGWARSILGVVFDGVSWVVDDQLGKIAGRNRYYRFQYELSRGWRALDNASPANIRVLKQRARRLLQSEKRDIKAVCLQL
jgi:patatin-like phospholipase/acyl hydrolase